MAYFDKGIAMSLDELQLLDFEPDTKEAPSWFSWWSLFCP